MNNNKTLFTLNYLPSVQFFSHWVNSQQPIIEKHCNYTKKSFRNRCDILAANGVIPLTVPIAKAKFPKIQTKDIEISYDTKWQPLHWRSIISAYNSSPFFEYYMDNFKSFYEKEYKYLFDFNIGLMHIILDALDLDTNLFFTDEYIKDAGEDYTDYRNIIHPKKDFNEFDPSFQPIKYRQVFQDRIEFQPNLSVIDLIFNKGPEAIDWLEDNIVSANK